MKRVIRFPICFILLIMAYLVSLSGSPAVGQGEGIALKSVKVSDQFPGGVLFQVAVETRAPAQIKEIKLELKVRGSNRGSYAYLEFEPATAVEGKYLLRTSGAQYKPPGTTLEYRLIISDSEQRILETPTETHLYLDNRFEWSHVDEGLVSVYYYGPTKTRAETIMKAAAQTIDEMGSLLGIKLDEPATILAYNSARDLIPAQPFESKASERELTLEGVTFPEFGTLLMISGVERPDGVASHEMTHFLVGKLTRNAYVNIPAWFSEGLAEYGNINRDNVYETLLSRALAQGHILVLKNTQSPPGASEDRLLMYGQGYVVVKFMIDKYGKSKFRDLFVAFNKGRPMDDALQSVYGFDQNGLDNAWRASLGLPLLKVEPATVKAPAPAPAPAPVTEGKERKFNLTLILVLAAAGIVALVLGTILITRNRSRSKPGA